MSDCFSRGTFAYFEEAATKPKDLKWFEKNRDRYEEEVKRPYRYLIKKIDLEIGEDFPGISISPSRLCRPVYPENFVPEDGTLVRSDARAFFSERQTSKFEWNPGVYLGVGKDENFIGVGLFRPSARQMKLLRSVIMENPRDAERILGDKKLISVWGELSGELFARFPKDFDPEAKGAQYLWHRQFYFHKTFTRKEVLARDFSEEVIKAVVTAKPFLQWLRRSVGVYERELAS